MRADTPRERVLRALDALLPYLHGFVNQAFDASAYRGKRVAPDIGPLVHAIKDEWRGAFAARLHGPVRNYLHELLDIRNRLSHSRPFNDDEARRACDTIRLVAQAIGAPLTEYDRRASYCRRAFPAADASNARRQRASDGVAASGSSRASAVPAGRDARDLGALRAGRGADRPRVRHCRAPRRGVAQAEHIRTHA